MNIYQSDGKFSNHCWLGKHNNLYLSSNVSRRYISFIRYIRAGDDKEIVKNMCYQMFVKVLTALAGLAAAAVALAAMVVSGEKCL